MKVNKKLSKRNLTYFFLLLTLIGTQFFLGCRQFNEKYIVKPVIKNPTLPTDPDPKKSKYVIEKHWYTKEKVIQINPDSEEFKELYHKAKTKIETSEKLVKLPDGIEFPEDLKNKIRYDESSQLLIFKGIMSQEEKDKLLNLPQAQDEPYKKAIEALFQRSQQDEAKDARNELIIRMMLVSDDIYQSHKAFTQGVGTMFNIVTRGLTSLFAGGATVFGGASTKTALSAGAALSNSTNAIVNQELYYQRLIIAIVRITEKHRKELGDKIKEKMKNTIEEYSVDQAIMDVVECHNAGSKIKGLEILTEKLETLEDTRKLRKKTIEEELELIKLEKELRNQYLNLNSK